MKKNNIPLSCTRGMHFPRKVGKDWVCMYCYYKVPTILDKIKDEQAKHWVLMNHISSQIQKHKKEL